MNISETAFHWSPWCAPVSCKSFPQLSGVQAIHWSEMVQTLTESWDMSLVWWHFDKCSLVQCKYILSRSSGPCCKQAKVRVAWLLRGIEEYWLESLILSSFHVCGSVPQYMGWGYRWPYHFWECYSQDILTINLCCIFNWCYPDFNFFLFLSKVSTEDIAAWIIVWSTITVVSRLALLTMYLTCSRCDAPGPFQVMLGLCE